jgi:hypothetical protein
MPFFGVVSINLNSVGIIKLLQACLKYPLQTTNYRFFAASPALPPPLLLALFAGLRCGSGKIVYRLFYGLGVAVGLGWRLAGLAVAVGDNSPVAGPVANDGNRRACDTCNAQKQPQQTQNFDSNTPTNCHFNTKIDSSKSQVVCAQITASIHAAFDLTH